MPVLLESLIFFLPDCCECTFQNLEYCKFSPLTSENPRLADDIKLITVMAVMKMEGGGGKINLGKKENTMANTLCSLSLYTLFCFLRYRGSKLTDYQLINQLLILIESI